MILAEQVATDINWTLICAIIMAIGTLGMWLDSRKQRPLQVSPQPLTVEIVKALHDQFANKDDFCRHVVHAEKIHNELFNRMRAAENAARLELGQEITRINADRTATMKELNEQLTFIRESLAAINRELTIRGDEL
jgi:hypothetical protein